MFKLINALLFGCFLAINAHLNIPLTYNTNTNILSLNKNNETDKKTNYTLPNNVVPRKYTLTITTHLEESSDEKFIFEGIAEIEIDVAEPVQEIILHSKKLKFDRNDVKLRGATSDIQEFSVRFDSNRDFVNITSLNGKFQKGSYVLKINYEGTLSTDLHGFYRSSYINSQGEKTWLATTHFEPVSARRAFPCFDEPEYKATFNLTIIHDKKYTAISNSKVNSVISRGNSVTTNFHSTLPMSTYLLAFIVSDFTNITNEHKNFSILARPNAIQHGNFALETGQKLLAELEKYTGMEFHLSKMDQAAVPDFSAGAMENWGLVIYREKSLLVNDKVTTTSEKQNIAITIAHEFAHQWFGNLVSPKNWKYLWLNEGFANFFGNYITELVLPEWHALDQLVIQDIQTSAFDSDSVLGTHPLNHDVQSPDEISNLFDTITYKKAFNAVKHIDSNLRNFGPHLSIRYRQHYRLDKEVQVMYGAGVIRMMQHFLTDRVFQKGLKTYLNKNSFKAATSDKLIESMQEVVNNERLKLDLKTILDQWLNEEGYPVVYVNRLYGTNKVEIRQERFWKYNDTNESKTLWFIPINYAVESKPDFNKTIPQEWLKNIQMTLDINIKNEEWLILNKQQSGFYRVNYDARNWKLLVDYLHSKNATKIHVLNRAQLINDALAFVKYETLELETLLNLVSSMKQETDFIAWYPGFKTFSWLKEKLLNTEYYATFKVYVLNTIKNLVNSVGLEETQNDKHLTKLARHSAVYWSCLLGNNTCRSKMNEKLVTWLNDTSKPIISPDLRNLVLCHGLYSADNVTWIRVLDQYKKTNDTSEKKNFLLALGCSNNKDILLQYFNYIVQDDSPFTDVSADINTAIISALENSEVGVDTALEFVVHRFITLLRKIKNEDNITKLFHNIGLKITTVAQLEKLKQTEKMDIPRSITSLAINEAEKNIQWLHKNQKTLSAWKTDVNSNSSSSIISSGYLSLITVLVIITHFSFN